MAMPAVAPVVGAVRLTVACALIDMMPGPLLPLAKTSVTPPVVSPGHAVEMVGVVVEVGGALMVAPPAPALSSSEEPLLNTYTPGQKLSTVPEESIFMLCGMAQVPPAAEGLKVAVGLLAVRCRSLLPLAV